MSSRLFLIPVVYDLEPELGSAQAKLMTENCISIKLPERLRQPVAYAVVKRKSFADVKSAAIQMDEDVLGYLIDVAQQK